MTNPIRGSRNIALKVPAHQFDKTVESYRKLGLPGLDESDSSVVFEYGPIRLHVDRQRELSQAEVWLELVTDDLGAAAVSTEAAGFERCDHIEDLGTYPGFWVSSPASIIHLVSIEE